MLRKVTCNLIAKLGPAAFDDMNWWAANTMLSIYTIAEPATGHELAGLDATNDKGAEKKGRLLRNTHVVTVEQLGQLHNPDARIVLGTIEPLPSLEEVAYCPQGIKTGDDDRWRRFFWEMNYVETGWDYYQSTVERTMPHGGKEQIIDWRNGGQGMIRPRLDSKAFGKKGIAVSQMRELPASLYSGDRFDSNVAPIVPHDPAHLPAIWCFCKSQEFFRAVRQLDQKTGVTNATLVKVPFDLERWQQVATEEYPNGLPEPHSNDPTQWLFNGHPNGSNDPLQVAVARLLGYRWPDQQPDELDALADADGIVPIPSVRGEPPAAERLREVFKSAFGSAWSGSLEHKLLTEAGVSSGTTLDDWLRNNFFEQHLKLFHQRPFIWHMWDGRKDGFSCLVNYHKLTHKLLDNLTYSYVQDWINLQAADARSGKPGADLRLADAQKLQEMLKLILAGEPPYDIFVRWKPLAEQPIGWNPDLNDGVRMNIRPFMTAGVLRYNKKPQLNINWNKDRGNEPQRPKEEYPWFWDGDLFAGDRVNDFHLTIKQKQQAREKAKRAK